MGCVYSEDEGDSYLKKLVDMLVNTIVSEHAFNHSGIGVYVFAIFLCA